MNFKCWFEKLDPCGRKIELQNGEVPKIWIPLSPILLNKTDILYHGFKILWIKAGMDGQYIRLELFR